MSVGPSTLVPEWGVLQKHDSLRTLILINCKINFEPSDSLTRFSRLRVLSIEGGDCDRLVASLSQLRHLRYLCLYQTNISSLPDDIQKLKFLQHIRFPWSRNLENLPETILKLVHLRTLDIYGSNDKVTIPKGFGRLTNLRTLKGFPVHMDLYGDGRWCSLEEIGPLSQLKNLALRGLQNVAASSLAEMPMVISSEEHLDYLELNWTSSACVGSRDEMEKQQPQRAAEEVLEKLCPSSSIRHPIIEGYFGCQLPNWMMVQAAWDFKSLRFLMLKDLPCCTRLPDGLRRLPTLESLHIEDAPAIKCVGPEFQSPSSLAVGGGIISATRFVPAFPNLTRINLEGLTEWEEWDWEEQGEDETVDAAMAMPALMSVTMKNCKLSCLPPGLASSKRLALRQLYLYELTKLTSLEKFPSVVELNVFNCPELKRINGLSRLQKIRIVYCPNLQVLEGLPTLDSMVL